MSLRLVTGPVHTFSLDTTKGYPLLVATWLLLHRTDDRGECDATMLEIAAGTGLGRTTSQAAMTELLRLGALRRMGTEPRYVSRYRWTTEVLVEWRALASRAGASNAHAGTENVYFQTSGAESIRYDDDALTALICETHLEARRRRYPQKRFALDVLERPHGPTILTRVRQLCELHSDHEPPRVVEKIMRRYMSLPASEKCLAKFHPLGWIVHSLGEIGAEMTSALTRTLPALDEVTPPATSPRAALQTVPDGAPPPEVAAELSRGLLANLGGSR